MNRIPEPLRVTIEQAVARGAATSWIMRRAFPRHACPLARCAQCEANYATIAEVRRWMHAAAYNLRAITPADDPPDALDETLVTHYMDPSINTAHAGGPQRPELVEAIRRLARMGFCNREIARRVGRSKRRVCEIRVANGISRSGDAA